MDIKSAEARTNTYNKSYQKKFHFSKLDDQILQTNWTKLCLQSKQQPHRRTKSIAEGTSQTRRVTRARAKSMPGIVLQSKSSRASGSQMGSGLSQSRPPLTRCSRCGRSHPGECRWATGACFSCGRQGHTMRECNLRGSAGGMAQSTGSVAGSSSSVAMCPTGQGIQAPAGRSRGRGGTSCSSGPSNRIYALTNRQD
ncbi:uncharacterized protein LOC114077994 [Solanum pennellii]|uniref:Uncharacterized protein LOC114077994 n=1 Tax=Solanum pennellii TaxID=28526 RepID=A0ABM1VEX2_SOLPN|nr:uncharacterized protein LOC114077994 [Solanum pennellii]